ncbi:MAG: efflux RND transporter periplasmic adaptor subunit [Bacteroidetes bacterium]|nr:efflux RND transporter periplasmic adaptor subunit [Bacteroidota bacterium]
MKRETIKQLLIGKLLLTGFLLLAGFPSHLQASGGDDHTHGEEEAPKATAGPAYFSTESSSDRYELLLRYEPIQIGQPSVMTLFVSEYTTNKPVDAATIAVSVREDAALTFSVQQTGEGTYSVEGAFPNDTAYSFLVQINSSLGPDLMVLPNILAGKRLTDEPAHDHHWYNGQAMIWVGLLLALGLGVAGGVLFQQRRTAKGRALMSLILLAVYTVGPIGQIAAHGDEDHGTSVSPQAATGNIVQVPKETQFLFELFTSPLERGGFAESTKLFGTIVPSSDGKAEVTSAQPGQILDVSVFVGQQVKAGQPLAMVEQSVDAGTQVSLAADRNALTAEVAAAQKEVDRLLTIKDIAARKDIDEAEARLQRAQSNLRLLSGNTARTMVLKSPINGVVAPFSLTKGSTVNPGQTLFTITDLSEVYVEAQVYDRDVAALQLSDRYTIECVNDNHKSSLVTLLSMAQEINPSNQTQKVLFALNNPDNEFKIGEFVNIRALSSTPNQDLSLPNSAITEINGKPVVFIKESAEQFSLSYVQLGQNNGTHTRILKGVEEGQRVVVNSSYQIKMIHLNQ